MHVGRDHLDHGLVTLVTDNSEPLLLSDKGASLALDFHLEEAHVGDFLKNKSFSLSKIRILNSQLYFFWFSILYLVIVF